MSRKKNREYRDYIEDIFNEVLNLGSNCEGVTFFKGTPFRNNIARFLRFGCLFTRTSIC